jgi:DNA polymerase-3 subunit gamma/tau
MVRKDIAAGLDAIQAAVDQGADARQIARQVIDQLRAVMQVRVSARPIGGSDLSEAEKLDLSHFAEQADTGLLLRGVRAFSTAINDMRQSTDSQMQIELAYLECVTDAAPAASPRASSAAKASEPARAAVTPAAREPHAAGATHEPAAQPAETVHVAGPAQAAGSPGETLRAQWPQLVKDVKSASASTASILQYCQPWGVEGTTVQIKASQDWQRARLDDPANKNRLIAALNRLLGGTYGVHVFVGQPQVDPGDDPVVRRAQQLGGKVRDTK